MNAQLGMNPERVESASSVVRGRLGTIDSAASAISRARLASLNPLAYGLVPGSLLVAPWAIGGTTVAIAQLRQARANAERLLGELGFEVFEQRVTSATYQSDLAGMIPGWMRSPGSVGTTANESWWNVLKSVFAPWRVITGILKGSAAASAAIWMMKNVRGVTSINALNMAWAFAKSEPFPKFINTLFDSKALVWATKAVAVVGSVVSVAQFVDTMWLDKDSTTWDKWRDGVSAGLAVTGTVLLFTPAAPIGAAILAVGAVWGIGTAIYDNREAIGDWMSDMGTGISNAAHTVSNAVGSAVVDAVGTVTNAAENVISAGRDFIDGIGRGWGFGW